MSTTYNVYCDESSHLEHDQQKVMVLGAVWCPLDSTRKIADRIREIKTEHGLPANFEIKWTKVSPAKLHFYMSLLDYFFDDSDLHFRALIVPDKSKLRHADFQQTHDDWYYKMYFDMLKAIFNPQDHYRIYVDIKDTRGGSKVQKLHEVLSNNIIDFSREIIERVQIARSDQIQQLQLADFLIGVISYANRELTTSPAKQSLVAHMRLHSHYQLLQSTLLRENKINLFRWQPQETVL